MGLAPPVIWAWTSTHFLLCPSYFLPSSFPHVLIRGNSLIHILQTKLHLRTQPVSGLQSPVLSGSCLLLQLHLVPLVPWDTALQSACSSWLVPSCLRIFVPDVSSSWKLFFLLSFLLICSQPKCYFLREAYPRPALTIIFNLTIQIRFFLIFFIIFCPFLPLNCSQFMIIYLS